MRSKRPTNEEQKQAHKNGTLSSRLATSNLSCQSCSKRGQKHSVLHKQAVRVVKSGDFELQRPSQRGLKSPSPPLANQPAYRSFSRSAGRAYVFQKTRCSVFRWLGRQNKHIACSSPSSASRLHRSRFVLVSFRLKTTIFGYTASVGKWTFFWVRFVRTVLLVLPLLAFPAVSCLSGSSHSPCQAFFSSRLLLEQSVGC